MPDTRDSLVVVLEEVEVEVKEEVGVSEVAAVKDGAAEDDTGCCDGDFDAGGAGSGDFSGEAEEDDDTGDMVGDVVVGAAEGGEAIASDLAECLSGLDVLCLGSLLFLLCGDVTIIPGRISSIWSGCFTLFGSKGKHFLFWQNTAGIVSPGLPAFSVGTGVAAGGSGAGTGPVDSFSPPWPPLSGSR